MLYLMLSYHYFPHFLPRYKLIVAEALVEHINPIRLKIEDYMKNPEYLCRIISDGNENAQETAEKTLNEVKEKVGLVNFNKLSSADKLVKRS